PGPGGLRARPRCRLPHRAGCGHDRLGGATAVRRHPPGELRRHQPRLRGAPRRLLRPEGGPGQRRPGLRRPRRPRIVRLKGTPVSAIGLPKLRSGKVRDVYEIGHDRLLMVASDRISAFDVVLDEPIPDKGRVLTGLSTFWFDRTADIVPNHLISADPTDFPETAGPGVAGRAMMVKACRPVLMECVVRGYLFGSAFSEYKKQGTVNGEPLPSGMVQAEQLPEPIFTPTTKADEGHDLALSRDDAIALVGKALYEELRD